MDHSNFLPHFINEEVYLITDSASSPEIKTIIVVEKPLSDADKQFLHKIFASVSLEPQQLTIAQASDPLDLEKGEIFYFGSNPHNLELYQLHREADLTKVYCHALDALSADQDLKRKLWGILKEVYANPKSP